LKKMIVMQNLMKMNHQTKTCASFAEKVAKY